LLALKEGQAHKKISLMKAMYENAVKKHNASVQIFLAKNWLGMSDKQEVQQTTEFKPLKVIISKETDTNGK